ncbi:DUF1080 domain-containing protein [Neolewinella lacunae]|uniref:DUF1080 domain-containing protein n=1 Tax=Neolewinella lacunae TaxID=1517758 RepID=A0A923TCY5_9BACT|nr:DUF1080 domain-containing protein [Neolewinella lacunae]MBC6994242.1 DUF1080 domain-containing protein [Neolewinella lacunae]MDN3637140.1 DUF1080 domain-containing protein [Neolewinella lacunae]
MQKLLLLFALPLLLFSCNKNSAKLSTTSESGFVDLFNGKDLDNWNLKIRNGDAAEAKRIFAVSDGMVHVFKDHPDSLNLTQNKGALHGLMYTKKAYDRYIFRFEYKWGKKIFNNFDQFQYDAGCYYHVYDDKIWPFGIEYQVRYNHLTEENHTGDYWASNTLFQWTKGADDKFALPQNGGQPTAKRQGEHRAANAKYHALDGGWNTCEVIVMDSTYSIHKLNGQLVNYATELSLGKGIIGLQCETAEIYYRNIQIKEFKEFVPASAFVPGLSKR